MKQPEASKSNSPASFVGSLFLFLLVILISSAPVVVEQMNKPERIISRILSHYGAWQVSHTSTSESQWEASDGSIAGHASYSQTSNGVKVIVEPNKFSTREAFFSKEAITVDVFRLSTQIDIPTACHNGLVFRGDAQGDYYLFLVDQESYTVEILQRKDNADLPREAIIPNTSLPKSVGKPHTITVIGDGQTYLFYINDIFVDRMSDSRLNGNRTGIEVFT